MSSFDHYSVYQLKVSSNRSFSAREPICHFHQSVVSIAHEEDIYGRILIKKKDWIEPLLFHFLSQEIYSGSLGETILL